jgi:ABC-type branched-subunit amino acid transport system ATPase component/ABC-type branched-subunit amino acid transport system permease subunit
MIEVIISGVVTGSLYAVAGLALLSVYRVSRVLNFSLGGLGAVAGYVASELASKSLPYPLVLVIAIATGAALGAITEVLVARPLARRDPLTIAVGTLGMLLILQGILGAHFGYTPISLSAPWVSKRHIALGSVHISLAQIFVVAVATLATLAMIFLVNHTRLGLAMRATSSGPLTAQLLGVRISVARLAAWTIGGAFGALAAMLVTPLTYLAPTSFTTFLITAFGAIVLGGFLNTAGVIVGAILFGVGMNLLLTYVSPGLPNTFVFLAIGVVLLVRPYGLFGRGENDVPEPSIARPSSTTRSAHLPAAGSAAPTSGIARLLSPRNIRIGIYGVILAVLVLVPELVQVSQTVLLASALATGLAVFGLNVLIGHAGLVSLGQNGFIAIGAYTAAIATTDRHWPVIVALLAAVAVSAVAGLIIGLPATRLSGIYLAVFTLAFGFSVSELVLRFQHLTGGASGKAFTVPNWLIATNRQYWFVLAVVAVVGAGTIALVRSRVGRAWRAVRDSEDGASALGLSPMLTKLSAFTFSAALAGLSGGLGALLVGYVSVTTYDVFLSVYLIVAVTIGGTASIGGGLLGALFITEVPRYTSGLGITPDVAFGVVLVIALVLAPLGVPALARSLCTEAIAVVRGRRRIHWDRLHRSVTVPPAAVPSTDGEAAALLELRGVSAGYGLGTVLHDLDLSIRSGEVVALIGANGAGKSTVLRTISLMIPRTEGQILWNGQPIEQGLGRSTSVVARGGVAHVPENRGIFPDLTVSENLAMGDFGRRKSTATGRDELLSDVLMQFPKLRERAKQRAGTLSGGEQQMLAIARALMTEPDLLMLDEPSLGLAPLVRSQVFAMIAEIAARGTSILLVEQNARAALAISDRAYVISGGTVVLRGPSEDLLRDDALASAYLAVK